MNQLLFRFLGVLLSATILTGCGSVHYDNVKLNPGEVPVATKLSESQKKSISGLRQAIQNLDANVSPQEATLVAHDAVIYPMILANQYQLTYPPLWHNVLVNSKKRPRGLCYHWQRDMIKHFKKKHLQTLDIKEGVAYEKDYWREHNTMVITAKGKPFNSGIVLDPWRHSGVLAWAHVTEDKYPWKLRVWNKKKQVSKTAKKPVSTPATAL